MNKSNPTKSEGAKPCVTRYYVPMSERPKPVIIQGGMGAAVSDWRLAKTVSLAGQLGVVSGTALDVILTRRLQMGDPGGHIRRALAAFPLPALLPKHQQHIIQFLDVFQAGRIKYI